MKHVTIQAKYIRYWGEAETAALISAGIGAAASAGSVAANSGNFFWARKQNFRHNEKAADNANRRAITNYLNYDSPQAKRQQLESAGLSAGLMYGNGTAAGQGVGTAAQGNGVEGLGAPQITPTDLNGELLAAQIENIRANTRKTDKEAGVVEPLAGATIDEKKANISKMKSEEKLNYAISNNYQLSTSIRQATAPAEIAQAWEDLYLKEECVRSTKADADYKEKTLGTRVKTAEQELKNLKEEWKEKAAHIVLMDSQANLADEQAGQVENLTKIALGHLWVDIGELQNNTAKTAADIQKEISEMLKNNAEVKKIQEMLPYEKAKIVIDGIAKLIMAYAARMNAGANTMNAIGNLIPGGSNTNGYSLSTSY